MSVCLFIFARFKCLPEMVNKYEYINREVFYDDFFLCIYTSDKQTVLIPSELSVLRWHCPF